MEGAFKPMGTTLREQQTVPQEHGQTREYEARDAKYLGQHKNKGNKPANPDTVHKDENKTRERSKLAAGDKENIAP